MGDIWETCVWETYAWETYAWETYVWETCVWETNGRHMLGDKCGDIRDIYVQKTEKCETQFMVDVMHFLHVTDSTNVQIRDR